MDARGFISPTLSQPLVAEPDLGTLRGRLLYLRDTVVERIPLDELRMQSWECGTTACLAGHACRDLPLRLAGLSFVGHAPAFDGRGGFTALQSALDLSPDQATHIFGARAYGLPMFSRDGPGQPTHAELRAHIDDVLSGRVR